MTTFRVKEELVYDITADNKDDAKAKAKSLFDDMNISIVYREGKINEMEQ